MKELSDKAPVLKEEERAFHESRVRLIRSGRIGEDERKRLLERLNDVPPDAGENDEPPAPTPGGVGMGVFYNNNQLAFNNSTILHFYILAPAAGVVGGGLNYFLFLTATNRAGQGVEALLSFYRANQPRFKVYDWSKPENARYALVLQYPDFASYLDASNVDGNPVQGLYVVNSTRLLAGTTWINEVFLRNQHVAPASMDLVYSNTYTLTSNIDQGVKFWGPIVEVFQQFNGPTNVLGFSEATLIQDGVTIALTPGDTYVNKNNFGLTQVYLNPNDAFLAN
jgi:hypothetical protein